MLGGPTTYVHAWSASPADILTGLKQGHAYITFDPSGPGLEMSASEALPGDSVTFPSVKEIQVTSNCLLSGDILQVVTAQGATLLLKAEWAENTKGHT